MIWFISAVFCAFVTFLIAVSIAFVALKWYASRKYKRFHLRPDGTEIQSVGFFHPYCNAGGGGERVLWCALRAVQERCPEVHCIVYTGDTKVTAEEIIRNAKANFGIVLPRPVQFVFLKRRNLVEARLYPHLTLLGQSLGSIVLGLEALLKFVPTVYLDTMGYAFTLPLFKHLGRCRVGCYVHYPTISTDMLAAVAEHRTSINNARYISRNPVLSRGKLIYYQLFALAYSICGRSADIVMVNSSWTFGHIAKLWRQPTKTFTVYPPCDVKAFEELPLLSNQDTDSFTIVSVAQFRPEKNHSLQLRTLELFLRKIPQPKRYTVKLVLVGSCRNDEDDMRVKAIKKLAKTLKIEQNVEVKLNVNFQELKNILQTASAGLHTMWNEHFGIGIVECMAAGIVVVAHDSGGPKMDIVVLHNDRPTGFLASTAEEYANTLLSIYQMSKEEVMDIRANARVSVKRFSEADFTKKFTLATTGLILCKKLS